MDIPYPRSLLMGVSRPARYVGGEYNQPVLDAHPDVTVCLAYPDAYEVGMSYTGLLILYHLLNDTPGIRCERVFAPWPDMETALRRRGHPLRSLESARPLREFDIVGFSLQYDLCFTNLLTILDLGGVPVRAAERSAADPWVIAGGPCATNPEPLADFVDAFCVGDGEDAVIDIVRRVADLRRKGAARESIREQLAETGGVYVPALYRPLYGPDGVLERIEGGERRVRRRIVDPEAAYFPTRPLVPHLTPIHDRSTLEVRRGCVRGCRFCQAGYISRPIRERLPATLVGLAESILPATGDDEIGLLSLSIGDYSLIGPLAAELANRFCPEGISLSLPSLRVEGFDSRLAGEAARVKRTSLTFAPEVGTDKMRRVVNKSLGGDDIVAAIDAASDAGFDLVKLYFMVGLPLEEMEDVDGIVELAGDIRRCLGWRRKRLNISVGGFVPKPHTPFQWFPQCSREELGLRLRYLRDRLSTKGTVIHYHDPRQSFLEAVFSRGDRRLGKVLARAYTLGCRFDQWRETFDFERWLQAFQDEGIAPEFYASRPRKKDEVFPWDPIDVGVRREFLWSEWERAEACATTPDCTLGKCSACGVCDPENRHLLAAEGAWQRSQETVSPPTATEHAMPIREGTVPREPTGSTRIRLEYSRRGPLAFVGHLDFQRSVQKLLRRAGVPVATSKGFHPHPKITFALPLPVGEEAGADLMDVELEARQVDTERMLSDLNRVSPPGLSFAAAWVVDSDSKKVTSLPQGVRYIVELWDPGGAEGLPPPGNVVRRWEDLLREQSIFMFRRGKQGQQQVDIRPFLSTLAVAQPDDRTLRIEFEFRLHNGRTARVEEVLGLLMKSGSAQVDRVCRDRILLRE